MRTFLVLNKPYNIFIEEKDKDYLNLTVFKQADSVH